ncbi:6724_t:CDS:2 [Gigaspora margarita]|uniref:6724_t:CDS:1 n=1 Tax=Gigaspora margarita TaxID=4874 RepID=A0ABM8VXP3_GIGMA|nr:6724_t:CDS:2 [Gigaspora margarita]
MKAKTQQSFNYLLKITAQKCPEFLIDFIKKFNPDLDPLFNLPFTAIQTTLKNLLTKFTQVFFTKLNYAHILRSHYSIPLYTAANRNKVAINLARLHLFLYNRYQTIHYQNFIQDLDIKPIRLTLKYNILVDEPNKPLFDIYNDRRFNIFVTLNLPKQRFLETFRIPSLKPYLNSFKEWYEKFFEAYSKQFEKINKTKVFNFIKYDIATKLSEDCKALLLSDFTISEISSFQECKDNLSKAALFHLHTCTDKDYQKLHATFSKPFPLSSFQELADQANQNYIKLNPNTTSSPQHITFYLYTYLKEYFHQAAKNDNIYDFDLDAALTKLISTTSDPHTLAREKI